MYAKTRDGADLYYEVYDFTDPWKPADSILLHHGNKATHNMWYKWIPLLARDFRVVVFDARGRGKSSIPEQGFNWSLDQFVTDAYAVMDDVGVDKFHWMGNSFGAVVGQWAGAKHADRLKSLTLLSPPYRFTNLSHVKEQWLKDYDRLGKLGFLRDDVPKLYPEDADPEMIEWNVQEMATMPEHVWKDLQPFTAAINLADDLPNISVPTMILSTTKSDRAPSTEAEFMKEQIPDCELHVFDTHHNIDASEEHADRIITFMTKHGGN